MRKDVKFGLVLFFLIVMTGGGYFLFADRAEKPVDLAADTSRKPEVAPAGAATPATRSGADRVTDRTTPPSSAIRQPRPGTAADATRTRGLGEPVKLPPGPQPVASNTDPAAARSTPPVVNRPVPDTATTQLPRTAGESTTNPGAEVARSTPVTDGATSAAPAAREPVVVSKAPVGGDPAVPTRPSDAAPQGSAQPKPSVADSSPTVPAATPGFETHRVTGGETFASLAKTYYGRPQLADFLIHSNPQIADPARLSAGTAVRIPPLPDERQIAEAARRAKDREIERTAAARPNASPVSTVSTKVAETTATGRRTYTVKSGDTFYDIAREQLGASSRWKELLELNKTVVKGDPKNLRPGQVLTLPDRAGEKAGT